MPEKKSIAIKKKEKKDLIFGGASSLMTQPKNEKEAVERKMIVLVSKALGINPFGVNILGNIPYTNNIGRKEKMMDYATNARFEYRWVQRALDDNMKAICEARVIDGKGKGLCDFVVGECSPKTMKMGTLQGYQNHMAQTRAENRAFEAAFGGRFRKDLFSGIQRELKGGRTSSEVADVAMLGGRTSYEEAVDLRPQKPASSDVYDKALRAIAAEKNIDTLEATIDKIRTSKLYNVDQKDQLVRMIQIRIALIKEGQVKNLG